MNPTVVFAHPLESSFNSAVLESTVRGIQRIRSGDVAVTDLYRRPGTETMLPPSCDTLVLVYPTWWTAQPALLWEWLLDRDVAAWSTVRTVVCVTTHGSGRLVSIVAGRSGRFALRSLLRDVAGRSVTLHWLPIYGLDAATEGDRRRMLVRVEEAIALRLRS